jgi:hypothetical protein
MKPVTKENTPEVSGGLVVDCEPVIIDPLPEPWPIPSYPQAPVVPVIDDPYTTIKL